MKRYVKAFLVFMLSVMIVMLAVTVAFSCTHHCSGEECRICAFIGNVSKMLRNFSVYGCTAAAVCVMIDCIVSPLHVLQSEYSGTLIKLHVELDN